ncbi:hypothetical protein J3R30DRAFT_3440782 [Lentinula aciculospora]|uniref:F-box domain-containing protein n=1 Tax=Lentinula aciculospora TaxID=153920 RepID=A0A9W9APZ5_9AGAR|nr:hypothetical protein J3R30DRAFT_3440782 [Lentinula aciculospora]
MLFSSLPAEIYAAFIGQLDEPEIRPTLLSLTRAIPRSPVPRYQLFRRIHITRADQLVPLYQRIRPGKQDIGQQGDEPCKWVQELLIETWTADAEIVLNLLSLLPNLIALSIWIGPKNFTPEHLEELFSADRGGRCLKCVRSLRDLSLRFRPYVQKANYYQFLSGSYFDSILEALTCWPPGRVSTLSIVQDPLTIESGTSEGSEVSPPPIFSLGLPQRTLAAGFAQPIVFFQLESTFPGLLRAPCLRIPLQSLRLRFPSRNITRSLTQAPIPHPPSYGASIPAGSKPAKKYFRRPENAHLPPTPYLKFLDLSTCLITESSLPQILMHFPSLTHIIADECNILRNGDIAVRDDSREWGSIAMSCVVTGIGKAKQKEKIINAWLDINRGNELDVTSSKKNARSRGRKGLATATLCLHKDDPLSGSAPARPSIPTPTISSSHDVPQRVRVLPPLPTLRHLTTNLYVPPSMISSETGTLPSDVLNPLLVNIHREWQRGWAEGLTQLVKVRERLHASWRNKVVRVMRFATPEELAVAYSSNRVKNPAQLSGTGESSDPHLHSPENDSSFLEGGNDGQYGKVLEDPLTGLIEVVDKLEFEVDMSESSLHSTPGSVGKAPVLCLAGGSSSRSLEQGPGNMGTMTVEGLLHTVGCSHEEAKKLWLDGIL